MLSSDFNNDINITNIVVIGSLGMGKSTFCNFLLDYGESKSFMESPNWEPCTNIVESKIFEFKTESGHISKFRVIDTPGLNERKFENELNNTKNIFEMLNSVKYINLLVICVHYNHRFDPQMEQTIEYYYNIFNEIFKSFNFMVVGTKVDNQSYVELYNDKKNRYLKR